MQGVSSFLVRRFGSPGARYAGAALGTLLALLLRAALTPLLGASLPYITLFPAIAFAALFCGVGASLVSGVVALLAVRYLFLQPAHSLGALDTPQALGMLLFAASSTAMVAIGELVRRTNATLYQAQGELEVRVQQRTDALNTANQSLGDLSGRLLHLQDEERRRIARELHDSVGQTLAALSMNLSAVGADIERLSKTAAIIGDSAALVDDMSTDIRTISYLLHPPLLDESGLSSALTWYIKGFSVRSKIAVDLEIPEDFGRLSRDLETAIFRVVQECLTNIHRHAQSPVAGIRISQANGQVCVAVQDKGKGIPPDKRAAMLSSPTGTPGVGIRGMRERLRQLGGGLEIHSGGSGKGTLIVARLPVVAPVPSVEADESAAAKA
jgi:signal transduction histidine kinase